METKELEKQNGNDVQEEPQSQENSEKTALDGVTPKKTKKYIQVLSYGLVLVPSVVLGVFGGLEIKNFFGPTPEVDYSSIDAKDLYPNYAKVEERYKKAAASGADFAHTLTPVEMAESAFCLIQKEKHVYSQGIGLGGGGDGVGPVI